MTIIFGNVADISGVPLNGFVSVRSPRWRAGVSNLVTTARKSYPVVGGVFRTGEVTPGAAILEFRGDGADKFLGKAFEVTVPDSGEVDVLDLLDGAVAYSEPVVSRVQELSGQAREAASEAKASAKEAGLRSEESQQHAATAVDAAMKALDYKEAAVAAAETGGKPEGGWGETDLAEGVREKLNAPSKPDSGWAESDLAADVQAKLNTPAAGGGQDTGWRQIDPGMAHALAVRRIGDRCFVEAWLTPEIVDENPMVQVEIPSGFYPTQIPGAGSGQWPTFPIALGYNGFYLAHGCALFAHEKYYGPAIGLYTVEKPNNPMWEEISNYPLCVRVEGHTDTPFPQQLPGTPFGTP